MFLNALPKTEAECPLGTNIYDDSCVLEGSGFTYGCPADQYKLDGECVCSNPGTVFVNGKCVPYVPDESYRRELTEKTRGLSTTGGGINPMLILAAAAAFFFAG